MKALLALPVSVALPVAVLLGAASAPPADMQSGRSVAVDQPQQSYWLSNDLNRLFLQKPAHGEGARPDKPSQ